MSDQPRVWLVPIEARTSLQAQACAEHQWKTKLSPRSTWNIAGDGLRLAGRGHEVYEALNLRGDYLITCQWEGKYAMGIMRTDKRACRRR